MSKLIDCNIRLSSGAVITSLHESRYATGASAVIAMYRWPDGLLEKNTISVNIVEHQDILAPGEFFLKNWSERSGMLEVLVNAKVIEHDGRFVSTGHVQAPIVRLNALKMRNSKQTGDGQPAKT